MYVEDYTHVFLVSNQPIWVSASLFTFPWLILHLDLDEKWRRRRWWQELKVVSVFLSVQAFPKTFALCKNSLWKNLFPERFPTISSHKQPGILRLFLTEETFFGNKV